MLLKLFNFFLLFKNINLRDNFTQLSQCDVLFFCHDVDRGISYQGKPYSPLSDSVRDYLEGIHLRCSTVAYPWSKYTGHQAHGEPVAINRSYFFDRARKKLGKFLNLESYIIKKNTFEKILDRTNPRLIITIGSPGELSQAARKRQIFHLELLHGIGYTSIPWGWDRVPSDFLPQGILSLDDVSTHSFMELTSSGVLVFQGPHPFLRRFSPRRQHELPKEWRPLPSLSRDYKKEVLVSLTWGYAGDHGEYTYFANILRNGIFYDEIAELVAERKDIFWRFRFHPVQIKRPKYRHLLKFMDKVVAANSNCEWRVSSSLPLPTIAMTCDCNISMSSMACYDLASMGVPSLLLCPTLLAGGPLHNTFKDLEQEGYVTKRWIDKNSVNDWISNAKRLPARLQDLNDDRKWEETFHRILRAAGLIDKSVLS